MHRTDPLSYANACHAAEVEVDIETGEVKILRYVALQDSGVLINPMMVEGQVHGGVAHGIGNTFYEWMGYDDAAQPVTTTFADYLLPTATEVPTVRNALQGNAVAAQPARRQGRRRGRHDSRCRSADLSGGGCADAVQRADRPGAADADEVGRDDPLWPARLKWEVGVPSDATRYLIRGGRIYDHDGDVHQPAMADILISGETIERIAPSIPAADGAEIIDAKGKLVLPGMVNAHYHSHDVLAKGLFEEMPFDVWTLHSNPGNYGPRSQREIRLRTLLGAVESLRNGITTIQDFLTVVPQDDATIDTVLSAYEEAGVRVVFAVAARDRAALDIAPFIPKDLPESIRQKLAGRTARRRASSTTSPARSSGSASSRRRARPGRWRLRRRSAAHQNCWKAWRRCPASMACRCSRMSMRHASRLRLRECRTRRRRCSRCSRTPG